MKKTHTSITSIMLALIALVPIGTSAFAQSEDDEEQNNDNNNYSVEIRQQKMVSRV